MSTLKELIHLNKKNNCKKRQGEYKSHRHIGEEVILTSDDVGVSFVTLNQTVPFVYWKYHNPINGLELKSYELVKWNANSDEESLFQQLMKQNIPLIVYDTKKFSNAQKFKIMVSPNKRKTTCFDGTYSETQHKKCPNCGNEELVYDSHRAETYCDDCGLVTDMMVKWNGGVKFETYTTIGLNKPINGDVSLMKYNTPKKYRINKRPHEQITKYRHNLSDRVIMPYGVK